MTREEPAISCDAGPWEAAAPGNRGQSSNNPMALRRGWASLAASPKNLTTRGKNGNDHMGSLVPPRDIQLMLLHCPELAH